MVKPSSILIIQMSQQSLTNYKAALGKHQTFLKKFKVFPDKTRKAIWAQLLQLPLNHQHFTELTKPYPLLPEHTLDKQVAFIVASLTKLYPDLNVQWLPGMLYPFVTLFREDAIAAFEISLTFLLNWLKPIFQDYPNSSKRIMGFLGRRLRKLEQRVNALDYPLSAIVQPLLLVSLTDILNKQHTLQVFDYLAAHPFTPELYLCIVAVILGKMEDKLCSLSSVEEIALVLRKEKKLDMEAVIAEAAELAVQEEQELTAIYSCPIFPLSKSRYPLCQFIVQTKPLQNNKLLRGNEQQVARLQGKFQQLEQLVHTKLKSDAVMSSAELQKRYADIEGQMRQYLNALRDQHKNKLIALKEMEDHYKERIAQQNQNHHYQEELQAIERRGRLEREILLMQDEAKSIREAEQAMLKRIQAITRMKREEIQHENLQLRQEQRRTK